VEKRGGSGDRGVEMEVGFLSVALSCIPQQSDTRKGIMMGGSDGVEEVQTF
jgi:hypothetical protein